MLAGGRAATSFLLASLALGPRHVAAVAARAMALESVTVDTDGTATDLAGASPLVGGKRTCARFASTLAGANEASGKRCAGDGGFIAPVASCAADSVVGLVGPCSSAHSCEECVLPMEQGRPLLFGMEGDWVCEPCEAARCAELVWGDG